jgi:signal transduction histidine kinase
MMPYVLMIRCDDGQVEYPFLKEISPQGIMFIVTACVAVVLLVILFFRVRKSRRVTAVQKLTISQQEQQLDKLTRMVQQIEDNNRQLLQNNDYLESATIMKDRLLSVIAHDLRSPVSSLQALLTLFNTNNIAQVELVDFLGKLLLRAGNTSNMLDNLLLWSQRQLKGFELVSDRVPLQKAIDECVNLYHTQAEQKKIVINNSQKTDVSVFIDVEMLKVIVRNLISNALKFTQPGGFITISTEVKKDDAVVAVKDTGVGMNAEMQEKLFTSGNVSTPGTDKEKGTGLGLMLCKDFVEQNHGKIWFDSIPNAGTTFYFSIPLAEE